MYKNYNKQYRRNVFFGNGNFTDYGKYVTYKSVLTEDDIILRTNNISYVHTDQNTISDILVVGNNSYIYLKNWQILKIRYRDEEGNIKNTHLVKLNRNYFKAYRTKEAFPNVNFQTVDDFNSLFEHARLQGLKKLKVEVI